MTKTLRELHEAATEGPLPQLRLPLTTTVDGCVWGNDGDELDVIENAELIAATLNALPLYLALEDAARTRERAEEALADAPSSAPEVPRLETERAEAILTIRAALAALDGAA